MTKDDDFDRLILNPTVINSRSYPYASFTKTIAPGYLIGLLRLSPEENLVISSDDLCEFYYTFTVSDKRAQRNAIGTVFKGDELRHLRCFSPELINDDVYIISAWEHWLYGGRIGSRDRSTKSLQSFTLFGWLHGS